MGKPLEHAQGARNDVFPATDFAVNDSLVYFIFLKKPQPKETLCFHKMTSY